MLDAPSLYPWSSSGEVWKRFRGIWTPPVEEDCLVSDDTKAHRQWLMRIWNK
jgi:hypothetical protein